MDVAGIELDPDDPIDQVLLNPGIVGVDVNQEKADIEAFLEPFIARANQVAAGS